MHEIGNYGRNFISWALLDSEMKILLVYVVFYLIFQNLFPFVHSFHNTLR